MERLTSVVAAIDFSDCSLSALETAARLAKRDGATLHVLHVIKHLVVADLSEALGMHEADLRALAAEQAEKDLTEHLSRLEFPAGVHLEVSFGIPLRELRRVINDAQADLLVMGVHGHQGPGRGVGVFASKAIRTLPVDVLLVRAGHEGPFCHVLACTDFSDTARRAVTHAITAAHRDRARLTLLHVYWGPWHRMSYRSQPPTTSPGFKREYMTLLNSRLARESASFAGELEGLEHTSELFDASHYREAIARFEEEVDADLVVLGTRGRTNLRDMFLGSTAEKVLRQSSCSLLAVKPEDSLRSR